MYIKNSLIVKLSVYYTVGQTLDNLNNPEIYAKLPFGTVKTTN